MVGVPIPTYLRFGCGHAAMVTLPRIAGEKPSERERRIEHEKLQAETRACDFCPPLEVNGAEVTEPIAAVLEVPESVTNGHVVEASMNGAAPEVTEPFEPVPAETEPLAAEAEPVTIAVPPTSVRPRRKRRDTRKPAPAATQQQRFRVIYFTDRIVVARSIDEAIERAEASGAGEIASIAVVS